MRAETTQGTCTTADIGQNLDLIKCSSKLDYCMHIFFLKCASFILKYPYSSSCCSSRGSVVVDICGADACGL